MHQRTFSLAAGSLLVALGSAPLAVAETVVTTYVTKVQEERQNTRWTLTEWLRIKERMRMMDLWLAMFSDPKKDRFRPELNIAYSLMRGEVALQDGQGKRTATVDGGVQTRAQLWLTNILSGTVGIRTLNVDLGGEVYQRSSGDVAFAMGASASESSQSAPLADSESGTRRFKHQYYTGNLRIFGRNIQDSSLVLKYGRYATHNDLPSWDEGAAGAHALHGVVAGAELQLYFWKWLGLEGNYLSYGDAKGAKGSAAQQGQYYDGMAFIEISLLRLMFGRYVETWKFDNVHEAVETKETGLLGGLKLQL